MFFAYRLWIPYFFVKEMTKKLNANIASSVSLVLIFSFNVSLFWCNGTDRFHRGAGNDQGTSVCSLQDKHASSQENTFDVNPSECSCICHVPMIATNTAALSYCSVQSRTAYISISGNPSDFSNRIFRPPIASQLCRFSFLSDRQIQIS